MALLGRDTKVTCPLGDEVLLLETFQGHEALGAPFRYSLTLLSKDPNISVDAILGQPMTVHLKLDTGSDRYFNGIVCYFAKVGLSAHHTRYKAVLRSRLSLFEHTRDCRILFDGDVPTHVTAILADRGFTDVESSLLQAVYRQREFTVQYRESDFNFVQRLLEEEGIYYFFKHEKNKHTLILADSASAHAPVAGYEKILYLPSEHKDVREENHFWDLSPAESLSPGKHSVLRGYDYTKRRPMAPQIEEVPSLAKSPGDTFEAYDYPGGFYEAPDAGSEAILRREVDEVARTPIEVEGNTMGLGVGNLVKLKRPLSLDGQYSPFWTDADFDKEYLITSARYAFCINQYETGDAAKDEPYQAVYTLLDGQTQFRPARDAKKPRVLGPQTALVVGPSGEEIYTDQYGRIKVQFDWDRLGKRNEKSCIWLRVAQPWAGKHWGAMFIPRIGQEVIVRFLDGDPDRPIVTSSVYNADNMPPYALPSNKTQSGIKSRSSKGGTADNFNELRFEDLKGKEEIHHQAEKDLNILVKNDETRTVGHDRVKNVGNDETTTVSHNRKEEVGNNEEITIHGNRTETVGKDETITIHGNRTEVVNKDETISISGQRTESVSKDETVKITGTRQVDVTKAYTLTVGGGSEQSITGDDELTVTKHIALNAGDEIDFKCGKASLTVKKDGTIALKGKDVTFVASGQINANASSTVTIKGSKVAIEKGGGGGGGAGTGAGKESAAPPEERPDAGPDVPVPAGPPGGNAAPTPSAQPQQAKPGGTVEPSNTQNTGTKKLTVSFDKSHVRCGAEVILQATSENVDSGAPIKWEIQQQGMTVETVDGRLSGASARAIWKSKAQTDLRPEPSFSMVGSAAGVTASASKNVSLKKYEDNHREMKTIPCSANGFGWTARYDIELKDGQIVITTKIKLINRLGVKPTVSGAPLPSIGPPVSATEKAAMKADIESKLSDKRLFHRAGCKRGDGCDCLRDKGCCKIRVKIVVEFVESGQHHVVNLFQGRGQADSSNWTQTKTRPNSHAHETGHLLGFYDEYAGGAVGTPPRWNVQSDVIMSKGLAVPAEYYWDFRDWLKSKCHGEEWTVLLP